MKIQPKEVKTRVLLHRRITSDYYRLRLLCPEIAVLASPGQFIMVRVNDLKDPFLRRPFGFSRLFPPREKKVRPEDEGAVEICYQVVGRGTSLMTQLREGQRLDVLGPLGKGFWVSEGQQRSILVGGGIGIAPLLAWAERFQKEQKERRKTPSRGEESMQVFVLIGAKNRERILGVRELKRMGLEPQLATEDGSLGLPGLATDLLERELLTQGHKATVVYACGPVPMLARVAQIAEQFDLSCQVLLEAHMACGVGACRGCAVKVKEESIRETLPPLEPDGLGGKSISEGENGEEEAGSFRKSLMPVIAETPAFRYARACKEGPVFEGREIIWE